MSATVHELREWLKYFDPQMKVAVDDGGLTLVVFHPDETFDEGEHIFVHYFEIGGLPLREDQS